MYSFRNDYGEGAHPQVLEALIKTNLVQTPGYGEDEYTYEAIKYLKKEIGNPDAAIHFISGGTQTNLITISTLLRPFEAVIAAHTGHINVHETGAIEATGHKVLTAEAPDGKLTPELIKDILDIHIDAHMVKPKMVYISNSTELGSIYLKEELRAISTFCKQYNLILFLDGARLGSALTAVQNDLTIKEITELTDCFYIGGTKNGALLGEALVICKPELNEDFRYALKQRGGMLAKGRLIGIQFLELFKNGLFYELATHANKMASILKKGIEELGYSMFSESPTNQLFPIFSNEIMEKIREEYSFEEQMKIDDNHTCIRFVTSWATIEEEVEKFLLFLKALS
jgi:Threonine aldolase